MSVPVRLYRALLRACRRFDEMPQPKSIEPLLNSPVVLRHAGIGFFLGESTAADCLKKRFRERRSSRSAASAINEGFHCLRVLQESEDHAKQDLVTYEDDEQFSYDDDESDEDHDQEAEEGSERRSTREQAGPQTIAIFPERPHFIHEPFDFEELLRGNERNSCHIESFRSSSHPEGQRSTEQLTLDLISAIRSDDALSVQSITSDILEISAKLIPQNMIACVIESCCSTLNSHLVFRIFDKLRSEGISFSPKNLIPLFQHAGEYDDVSTAFAALRETRWGSTSSNPVAVNEEPNDSYGKTYMHAVMWICSNLCHHDIVEKLFQVMMDRGFRPDRLTQLVLIRSICINVEPDIPRALEVVTTFDKDWGIPPSSDAFNLLLFACYNSPVYNLNDAIKLLRVMERHNIQPTRESYQALLLCAATDEKDRIPNTSAQLNSIMKALSQAGFVVDDLISDIANKLAAKWRL